MSIVPCDGQPHPSFSSLANFITASQSDMRDRVVELKESMATKKDLESMATRIIETVKQLLQQKPGE